MIFSLKGKLLHRHDQDIVIDVSGIGYQCFVTSSVLASVPAEGEDIHVYTYHYVREDQQVLYGFSSIVERALFTKLITVSGVGPKVAIRLFSGIQVSQLHQAIAQGQLNILTSVSGVGKKMAERIVIELQDKLPAMSGTESATGHAAISMTQSLSIQSDLTGAMRSLGYGQDEVKKALMKAGDSLSEGMRLEDGIKLLLKYM